MGHSSKVGSVRRKPLVKFGGSGVGTQDSLPRAHMLAHQGTVERSNADGYRRINGVLVNVLTKGQGGAILQMEDTNLQELKKIENGTNRE